MMDVSVSQLPPNDPRLVEAIVGQLKSKGIFDRLRKECLADVDTKPAFQNLKQRVDAQVESFLSTKKWSTDLNKNQLRDSVRKNVQEAGILDTGIDAIINQVVNPKVPQLILPCVEDTVFSYLKIPRPNNNCNESSQFRSVMNFRDDCNTTLSNDATESTQPPKLVSNLPVEADAISSEEDETLLEPAVDDKVNNTPTDVVKVDDENAVDCFGDTDQESQQALSLAKLSLKGAVEKCEPTSSTDSESITHISGKANNTALFEQLDSISSNSSGLSFSPPQTDSVSKPLEPPTAPSGETKEQQQSPFEMVTSTNSPLENSATSSPFSNVSQTSMPASTDRCSSSNSQRYDSQDSKEQTDAPSEASATDKVSSTSTSKNHGRSSSSHSSHQSKHHKHSRHRSKSKHSDDHYSHKKNHSKSHRKDDDSDSDKRSHKKSSHSTSSSSHKSSSSHRSHRQDDRKSSHHHSSSSDHGKSKSSSHTKPIVNGITKSSSASTSRSSSSHKHKSSHKSSSSTSSSRKDSHSHNERKREQNNNKMESPPAKRSRPKPLESSPPQKRSKLEETKPVTVNGAKIKERMILCSFTPKVSSTELIFSSSDSSDFEGFPNTDITFTGTLDDLFSDTSSDEMGFEGFPDESPRKKISARNKLKRYIDDYITVNTKSLVKD